MDSHVMSNHFSDYFRLPSHYFARVTTAFTQELNMAMNTTNTTTFAPLDSTAIASTANADKGSKWLYWLATVLLIRWLMVERKWDGARFGVIGLINGAVGRIGDGEDEEWAALYHRLQADGVTASDQVSDTGNPAISNNDSTQSSSEPSPRDVGTTLSAENLPQRNEGLNVRGTSIGMAELWLRKNLWSRWIVDMFTCHRMYWFGPSIQNPDLPRPLQSRRRLNTARNRYGDQDTRALFPANPDQLTLIYGTRSVVVPEGTGQLDSMTDDKDHKALRYGFYFAMFGFGLSMRSIWFGLIVTFVLEVLLLSSWLLGRNLSDEHRNFCNRVSRSAECIEQIARTLVPEGRGEGGGGRRTLDVVLHHGSTITWCRCAPTEHPITPEHTSDNNTWMSLCIPKSHFMADTAFAALGLLSHTLLPWGWVRFRPNLAFAGFAIMLEAYRPGMGLLVIFVAAPMPTWVGIPDGVWQHEDNWTLAWYLCLTLWMSGYTVDFQAVIEWIGDLLETNAG